MFKSLGWLGAALKRVSSRKQTLRALNELPPETQKDINRPHPVESWPESVQPYEIRLPF
jgi:hypothetical protein